MNQIDLVTRTPSGRADKLFTEQTAKRTIRFHESFPEYCVTPMAELSELAKHLGVASIAVKDESYRFGLNAFKVLGGTNCIGTYLAGELGESLEDVSYGKLVSAPVREKLGKKIFVTAICMIGKR